MRFYILTMKDTDYQVSLLNAQCSYDEAMIAEAERHLLEVSAEHAQSKGRCQHKLVNATLRCSLLRWSNLKYRDQIKQPENLLSKANDQLSVQESRAPFDAQRLLHDKDELIVYLRDLLNALDEERQESQASPLITEKRTLEDDCEFELVGPHDQH